MRVPREEWVWFGSPGHLIIARDCRFHMATEIGPWWVSSVGEYLPDSQIREMNARHRGIELMGIGDARRNDYMRKIGFEEIGSGRLYETMVFPIGEGRCLTEDCDCGRPNVANWGELDADVYNTRGAAQRGHLEMCLKWADMDPEGVTWDEYE